MAMNGRVRFELIETFAVRGRASSPFRTAQPEWRARTGHRHRRRQRERKTNHVFRQFRRIVHGWLGTREYLDVARAAGIFAAPFSFDILVHVAPIPSSTFPICNSRSTGRGAGVRIPLRNFATVRWVSRYLLSPISQVAQHKAKRSGYRRITLRRRGRARFGIHRSRKFATRIKKKRGWHESDFLTNAFHFLAIRSTRNSESTSNISWYKFIPTQNFGFTPNWYKFLPIKNFWSRRNGNQHKIPFLRGNLHSLPVAGVVRNSVAKTWVRVREGTLHFWRK